MHRRCAGRPGHAGRSHGPKDGPPGARGAAPPPPESPTAAAADAYLCACRARGLARLADGRAGADVPPGMPNPRPTPPPRPSPYFPGSTCDHLARVTPLGVCGV
ncbi:hypothetical protein GCM10010216_38420 [Streptomyces flaveolus]|nr:hypothetical protein GCM10010216_38420 [Streptomyces flaveolus]